MLKSQLEKNVTTSTADAFYQIFRALPEKDKLLIAQYIMEDKDIQHSFDGIKIPNGTTIKSFSEDKSVMPLFNSVEELRKDLLS